MSLRDRTGAIVRPVVFLAQNPLTLVGAAVTTSTGITLVFFWLRELFGRGPVNPYAGIVLYLILPGVFLAGLLLMPAGVLWRRRRLRARNALPAEYPEVDLGSPVLRKALFLVAGLTGLNVAMMGTASYKGVEYMDSKEFCGQACHTVMEPEYTAYVDSPHSRVACTDCHIGPGASWFVRSKVSGARQLLAVNLGTYSRPIPSPVKHLRPARETCEHCHWPEKFQGDRFVVRSKFSEDEKNTRLTTVLALKVGGQGWKGATGIHGRHLNAKAPISYIATDARRQVIPIVSYTDEQGKPVEYASTELKPTAEELAKGERRQMDCIDCHNRPSHAFQTPERAVDGAMADGSISPDLPWAKKKAIELLKADYPDRPTAEARITSGFVEFYRKEQPEAYKAHRNLVEAASQRVAAIYLKNVFPQMKVTWGVHPNNLGHDDFPGCFRCHDDKHKAADGRTITQDCGACHNVLAMEESNPKVLADLGLE